LAKTPGALAAAVSFIDEVDREGVGARRKNPPCGPWDGRWGIKGFLRFPRGNEVYSGRINDLIPVVE
jgi:hypothetical protein